MKKRAILAIVSLVLLSLLVVTPYLIEGRSLQGHLLASAEQTLGVKASVSTVGWSWLPMPGITLTEFRAESTDFSLVLPKAHFIINPGFFFSNSKSLSWFHAQLYTPDITIKKSPAGATLLATLFNPAFRRTLPLGRLHIDAGTLHLPEQKIGQKLTLKPFTISDLDCTVTSLVKTLAFRVRANSTFGKDLNLKASVDLARNRYQITLSGDDIDSGQLLDHTTPQEKVAMTLTPAEAPVLPVATGLSLSAQVEGTGQDQFQLTIDSKKTPFALQWRQKIFQVTKIDGLVMKRQGSNFSLDIKDCALNEPRLRLNGRIARQSDSAASPPNPAWSIDLKASDINLGAVRAHILDLFGDNLIAQKVCTIVRGGRATSARYAFQGKTADFQHLRSMKIWVDTQDVPIHLPALGLDLDRASGPIAISDGRLTGKDLSATIDKSQGTKGELLFDLEHDKHGFHLDLDLAADLENLHDVLSRIIPSPRFQEELGRFIDIKGQAQGHLRLGDDLRHVQTEVDVLTMQASGTYDRLPWPFTITAGRLQVTPLQVDWHEVRGKLGKQRINSTTGRVDWQDSVHATLNALNADLDLKSLLEEGALRTDNATLAVRDFVHGRFSELSGRANLSNSSFSGPVSKPKAWRYQTSINCSDLVVTGERFPELQSQNVQAEITQQQADFAGIFALFGQEIFLSGQYQHSFLEKWHGALEINGDIGEEFGDWLLEKEVVPMATFPKLPFRLEKFVINNPGPGFESILAQGTIIPLPQKSDTRLLVSINRQPTQASTAFTFMDGNRQGSLNYQTWPGQDTRKLVTWQGELTYDTLDAFFAQPFLQSGHIKGAFSRLTEDNAATYSGSVQVNDIKYRPQSLTPDLTLDTLSLQGNGNTITVEQGDIALAGVPAFVSGTISEGQGLHALDLQVQAPKLAWESIKKTFAPHLKRDPAKRAEDKSFIDTLRGAIAFDIGAFNYTHSAKNPATTAGADSHTFIASPFKGRVNFTPAGLNMQVHESKLCGISNQGSWYFGDQDGENTVRFSSGSSPLSFEEALPCLGIDQGLIVGPFSLEGQISGRPKQWRQGNVTLTSPEGLIKRMNLLSQIFTAVNFTDYLTWEDLPDIKGQGLPYSELTFSAHVDNNNLVLDRSIIKGKGVNLSGRGTIDLTDLNSDLTFFIAPFKGLDWMLTNLPLIGKALGGPKESILTFPVAVSGNIRTPEVTALAPTAIGSAFFELFRDTVTLPFRIFEPTADSPPQGPPPAAK